MSSMAAVPDEKTQSEIMARAEKIAALRTEFGLKMQTLRSRQRALLEKVVKRLDAEEAEKIRKSLLG